MVKPASPKSQNSSITEVRATEDISDAIARQIGDIVPQKQRDVIVARMTSLMVSEHFTGPIAHPRHLKGYEEVTPGAADRIIAMAEKQQEHHIAMDEKVLVAEESDRRLGMWLGAAAFVFLIACALVSALVVESVVIPGLFLGTAAIGGVGLFIRGRANGSG